jgi:hypothetical protein
MWLTLDTFTSLLITFALVPGSAETCDVPAVLGDYFTAAGLSETAWLL